jgi:predicted DNA-binding transcriptional regulator AlpA
MRSVCQAQGQMRQAEPVLDLLQVTSRVHLSRPSAVAEIPKARDSA